MPIITPDMDNGFRPSPGQLVRIVGRCHPDAVDKTCIAGLVSDDGVELHYWGGRSGMLSTWGKHGGLEPVAIPAPGLGTSVIPVSVGELVDKLTILDIKSRKLANTPKSKNILHEYGLLFAILTRDGPGVVGSVVWLDLLAINERLWEVEDEIRECERNSDFGEQFIILARSVYHLNDKRSALKRRLNDAHGSAIVEEKSYADYQVKQYTLDCHPGGGGVDGQEHGLDERDWAE